MGSTVWSIVSAAIGTGSSWMLAGGEVKWVSQALQSDIEHSHREALVESTSKILSAPGIFAIVFRLRSQMGQLIS